MSSSPDFLVLHALLLAGVADAEAVARRFDLNPREVHELLLDDESRGWVQRVRLTVGTGWTLTRAGQREHSRHLAQEVGADVKSTIRGVYEDFVPLDVRFMTALGYWQTGPAPREPWAVNEHRNSAWDERILIQFHVLLRDARPLCARLEQTLDRFRGYADRLATALRRVDRGDWTWLDQQRDVSLLSVWAELREDLQCSLEVEGAAQP
jgi:hypothetical protein